VNDHAHELTDKELSLLEWRIGNLYREAAEDMSGKIDEYFSSFEERDKKQKALVDAGKLTQEQYDQWRLAQIGRGKRMEALRDQLAERMTAANEVAAAYINDATPGIYSLNRNYAAYTIEQVAGDVGFDIWDESTVRRLIVENPISMPYYPVKRAIDRKIDLAWGQQQITRQITTGILQGESIGKIANRLQEKIPDMNRVSAVRAARTAMTSAQNAGRMDSYVAAQKMGIKLRREWVATLDNRTRHAHAILDGQKADIDKPFEVEGQEIMFPGDPHAHPSLVYNCRCTLIAAVEGADMSDAQRRARNPETGRNELISNMSYREWEAWKKAEMSRRRIGEQGQEIIDKATYNKLTKKFIKNGGIIIRGDEAAKHLVASGAYASYLPSLNAAFIRDDATISDVLEEIFHAEQDRKHRFGSLLTDKVRLKREIEAQKYLISVAEKYKIPVEELEVTQANLERYELQLKLLMKGGN